MNTSKIIRGIVNSRGYTITSAITQWDYGYVFVPEFEDLPATYRLDFSNDEHHGTALPVYCGSEGGEVPEELIDTGKDIWVWFFYIGDGFGKSEYKWKIPNKCKPKTEQDEPTPAQQSSIDQAIAVVNDAVETVEEKAEEADTSARNAKEDADRAEQARDDAQTAQRKAEEAQESSERAKDDAQTSERNASESERKAKGYADTASEKADSITGLTAQATTLPDGSSATASYDAQTGVMSFGIPKGKDGTNGIDGDDGYSPTANVSKSGKTATITITDKNGTTSAQVSDGEDGATGATPNLTIGTVETLEPTESATATITGTPENPVLNLGIPQGEQGEVTLEDYYKAFPTDTASGSIASFPDGADDLPLKSLVVDINPIQDLSHGDPSPENICPISGWTQVGVEQRGKNLCSSPLGRYNWANGVRYSNPTGAYCATENKVKVKGGQTYTVSFINAGTTNGVYCAWFCGDIFLSQTNFYNANIGVVTAPNNADTMAITFRNTSAYEGDATVSEVTIEFGSTATPYEPYTGRSITIDLGQTVYGGKLDVLTGILTVYPYYDSYNGETLTGEWISDRDKYVAGTAPTIGAQVVNIGAQGVTVQLEPHEVESLHGVNNLWADSGDTTAEYRADTKLYIERLTAPDSTDMIADANITSSKYFMVGNSLYKATANIANGAQIIVGTNCIRKSLSEALNEINA